MDVAADEDSNSSGKDIERGAGNGHQAIGSRIGVVASGRDTQAGGSQLEFPDRPIHDPGVGVFPLPTPHPGLFDQQPEGLPLDFRRGRQRMPAIAERIPPTEHGLLPIPLDARPTPEDRAIRELEDELPWRAGFT